MEAQLRVMVLCFYFVELVDDACSSTLCALLVLTE